MVEKPDRQDTAPGKLTHMMPLRSFLTAIDLQMEDEGIKGDEPQVRYVEG